VGKGSGATPKVDGEVKLAVSFSEAGWTTAVHSGAVSAVSIL